SRMRTRHSRPAVAGVLALVLVALVVGLSVLVVATTATAQRQVVRANSITYQDSTGEVPAALDISAVTVSNDDTGLVTFDIRFANRSVSATTDSVYVVIDADRDESTGDPGTGGGDWFIAWHGSPMLLQWNGTDSVPAPSMTTLLSLVRPNELVIKA